jgi:transposase
MAYNFLACDRDQAFLLPPDLRDWLPSDHLAWFILDVVDQLDLGPFLKAYRADGHGRAAYAPRMLLAVLLYAYCSGIRSSRQIERRLKEDIAFRVLAGNRTPDHVTIARFRVRHEQALAGLLVQSLKLCAAAGMVRLGWCAWDWSPWTAPRSRPTPPPRPTAPTPTSRPRSPSCSPRPPRPTGPTISSTAPPRRRVPASLGRAGRAAGPTATGQGPPGGRGGRPPAALPAAGGRAGRRRPGPRSTTPSPHPAPPAR